MTISHYWSSVRRSPRALAKQFRKANFSFVVSVHSHGNTMLPLDGLPLRFSSQISNKVNQKTSNLANIIGALMKTHIYALQYLPYLLTYLLTHSLTPWCRAFLEQLTGLQLVKKFPAFHGTRRFITALTSVRHLWPVQSSPYTHIPPPGDPS